MPMPSPGVPEVAGRQSPSRPSPPTCLIQTTTTDDDHGCSSRKTHWNSWNHWFKHRKNMQKKHVKISFQHVESVNSCSMGWKSHNPASSRPRSTSTRGLGQPAPCPRSCKRSNSKNTELRIGTWRYGFCRLSKLQFKLKHTACFWNSPYSNVLNVMKLSVYMWGQDLCLHTEVNDTWNIIPIHTSPCRAKRKNKKQDWWTHNISRGHFCHCHETKPTTFDNRWHVDPTMVKKTQN